MKNVFMLIVVLFLTSCSVDNEDGKVYDLEPPKSSGKAIKNYKQALSPPSEDKILSVIIRLENWVRSEEFFGFYMQHPGRADSLMNRKLIEIIPATGLESGNQYRGAFRQYYKDDPEFRHNADSIKLIIRERVEKVKEIYEKRNKR